MYHTVIHESWTCSTWSASPSCVYSSFNSCQCSAQPNECVTQHIRRGFLWCLMSITLHSATYIADGQLYPNNNNQSENWIMPYPQCHKISAIIQSILWSEPRLVNPVLVIIKYTQLICDLWINGLPVQLLGFGNTPKIQHKFTPKESL